MLNIDSALPSDGAPVVQVDTSTSQIQDGAFSLALEAEYEKMLVSAESTTEAPPALVEDLKSIPLPDTSALKVAVKKDEAGKSEQDSLLSAISLLAWAQPLWQNLPGFAGEQLPGKETTSPLSTPLSIPPSIPGAVRENAQAVTEAMLPLPVPPRVGDAGAALAANAGLPIPEQTAPSDYVAAAVHQPMAIANLPVDLTGGETLKATVNADDAIETGPDANVPPQQVRLIAREKTMPETVSEIMEHASAISEPDKVVEKQSGSTKAPPFDTADRLRLEGNVSIVHAAGNPKPAGSNQPEATLQKEADPVGSNPSVPLASAETAASNGDVQEQQSQASKHNNPEINISRRPAEPEEEQRSVHVTHEPTPEAQLPSDPRGHASSHDTSEHLAVGSSKATETPSVPQAQVWNRIEESNVISQLVAKARGFQWEKNSEIVISLKPESLGRLSLRASIVDQTVVATIVTESDKVKNLIELEMPVLHHALQENGMPVKVVVVHGSDLSFSNTAGNGQSHLYQNPLFQQSNGNPNLWPQFDDRNDVGLSESADVVDSRYRSSSIHLIA